MYSHESRVVLSPWKESGKAPWLVSVSLQETSSLEFQAPLRTARMTIPTTPFPNNLLKLLRDDGDVKVTRILLQAGSSSSKEYPTIHRSTNNYDDLGPSGVTVTMEFQHDSSLHQDLTVKQRFYAITRRLVGERVILAPLDSIRLERLHRHLLVETYTAAATNEERSTTANRTTTMQLTLPLEGAPMASEGIFAFQQYASCGIRLSAADATELSNLLMGDSKTTLVAHQQRRSLWIDLQLSTCGSMNHPPQKTCQDYVTLSQGVQYTVVLPRTKNHTAPSRQVSLSQLLPFLPNQEALTSSCPLADSNLAIQMQPSLSPLVQYQCHGTLLRKENELESLLYRVPSDWNQPWLTLSYPTEATEKDASSSSRAKPYWRLDRTIQRPRGVAQDGTLISRLHNDHNYCSAHVRVTEILPKYLHPRWTSLTFQSSLQQEPPPHVDKVLYMETDGGTTTFVLKWNVTLPPRSSVTFSLNYDPAFLSFQQFPADPNRGMELPPTRARWIMGSGDETCRRSGASNNEWQSRPVPLYSDPLLLMPPVPDMSMPFNVISLTCTFYAFVVGSLVNLLVRKSSERIRYKLHPQLKPKSKLTALKERFRKKFSFLTKRWKKDGGNDKSASNSNDMSDGLDDADETRIDAPKQPSLLEKNDK